MMATKRFSDASGAREAAARHVFLSFLCLVLHWRLVAAQNCYYPNGDLSTTDAPCNTSGDGPCCPLHWQCLSNGLCYYDAQNLTGRYTCTDRTWKSSSCPQFCTKDYTATGGEAILQCSSADTSYCCDGDRSFDCCTTPNMAFFSVAHGNIYTTINNLGAPSSVAPKQSSAAASSPASSPANSPASSPAQASGKATPTSPAVVVQSASPSSASDAASAQQSTAASGAGGQTSASGSAASSPAPGASTIMSLATSAGVVSTVYITNTPTAELNTSSSSSSSSHNSKLGLIIGLAVGIPLGLALLGLLAFLLLRRRRRTAAASPNSPDPGKSRAGFLSGFRKEKPNRTSEIDGYPVGTAVGFSEIDGREAKSPKRRGEAAAELPGNSPASSMATAPPGYSPGMAQGLWGTNGAAGTGVDRTSESYVPYRPGPAELPG